MFHLYRILVTMTKNWQLVSWELTDLDIQVFKIVRFISFKFCFKS
jgi:hypothetical protein